MIWQNPFAWLGLVSLALPIAIHLLGRRPARRERFPTLRFFDDPRLLPARRTKLQDIPLLLLRMALLAAAVAALAQPLVRTHGRQQALEHALARVVIVDTSASVRGNNQIAPAGTGAAATAQREITRLSPPADVQIVLYTVSPGDAIPGAVEWLAQRAGRAELLIISDFQIGTIDSATLARVPATIGIHLVRVPVAAAAPNTVDLSSQMGAATRNTHVDLAGDRAVVTWSQLGRATTGDSGVVLFVGPAERAAAAATLDAARQAGIALPIDTARAIALAFPNAPRRNTLRASAEPVRTAWMLTALTRATRDSSMRRADATAGEATLSGRRTLVLFPNVPPGTLAAAQLTASLLASRSTLTSPSELDPELLDDGTLARWQRTSTAVAPPVTRSGDQPASSDGRWLWLLVLLLLGAEAWVRRDGAASGRLAYSHDRAA